MIKIDPFETREKAIKTLLKYTHDNLLFYVSDINGELSNKECFEYFLALYKKYPEDFKLISPKNKKILKFMDRTILEFVSPKIMPIENIDDFYAYWEYLELNYS